MTLRGGVRGEVEDHVEHGDIANDQVNWKGHNISLTNIVENHQSHRGTESHTRIQSDDPNSQDVM